MRVQKWWRWSHQIMLEINTDTSSSSRIRYSYSSSSTLPLKHQKPQYFRFRTCERFYSLTESQRRRRRQCIRCLKPRIKWATFRQVNAGMFVVNTLKNVSPTHRNQDTLYLSLFCHTLAKDTYNTTPSQHTTPQGQATRVPNPSVSWTSSTYKYICR